MKHVKGEGMTEKERGIEGEAEKKRKYAEINLFYILASFGAKRDTFKRFMEIKCV
jgi:hypothetical protein